MNQKKKKKKREMSKSPGEIELLRRRIAELEASESEWRARAARAEESAERLAVVFDTKIERAEQELAKSQQHLRHIMDALFGFIGVYTAEGVLVEVNRSSLDAAAREPGEVLGKLLWDSFWWNHDTAVQDRLRKMIAQVATGEIVYLMERMRVMDSVLIDIDLCFEPVRNEDGAVAGIIGYGVDITEHTQAARALRENEQRRRLRLAVEAAGLGAFSLDLRQMAASFDARSAHMLGYHPHELQGRDAFFDALHPNDRARTHAALTAYLDGCTPIYEADFRLRTKQGQWKWILAHGRVVERDAGGQALRMLGTHTDIDERNRAAEELHESQERFRLSFETTPIGVIMLSLDSHFMHCNAAFTQMVGYSSDELDKKTFANITHPEDIGIGQKEFQEMTEGKRVSIQVDKRFLTRDGRTIWVSLSGAMIKDSKGKALYSVVHALEITERWLREEELRQHANVQEILIQEINHRVGNILSSILAMSQLEREQLEGPGRPPPLGAWHKLERRISGLATVHSMMSQSMWRPIRARELCEQIVSTVCHGSDQTAELEIQGSDVEVTCDQAQNLALVMSELVLNSMKHGSLGDTFRIAVSVSRKERDVVVVYRDNGPGYPDQAMTSNNDETRGGLGLGLVERIISRTLKGKLTLASDGGAIARMRFPFVAQAPHQT